MAELPSIDIDDLSVASLIDAADAVDNAMSEQAEIDAGCKPQMDKLRKAILFVRKRQVRRSEQAFNYELESFRAM